MNIKIYKVTINRPKDSKFNIQLTSINRSARHKINKEHQA